MKNDRKYQGTSEFSNEQMNYYNKILNEHNEQELTFAITQAESLGDRRESTWQLHRLQSLDKETLCCILARDHVGMEILELPYDIDDDEPF